MSQIVVDEPETDNLLHILPESVIEALERIKRRYARWREKPRNERYSAYLTEKASKEIPGSYSFEEFDELMRVALDELELWEVDYAAIPFGHDQPGKGIYSAKDGRRFYLGVQDWLMSCNTRLTFLTTEALVARVLAQLYEAKLGKRLIALDLYARCKLFPIEIPLVIDRRAAADRHEKTKVSALAAEILRDHPNAILIANGSDRSDPRIKTFQAAKGLNGLEDNDVFIIPTWLSPEQYAELNLIAQWLEIPSAVTLFYEDQISQAVGRNTGFRKSEKSTKTKVVCSNRLAKRVLAECFQDNFARIRLVRDSRR
jgi:hypothetical protein